MGLYLVEHNRTSGAFCVRGKVAGVRIDLTRHPKREKAPGKWNWTLKAHEGGLRKRVEFSAERTGLGGLFRDRDYTSGDPVFDDAVRLTGEPHTLCVALTTSTRRWVKGWVDRGGALVDDTLSLDFRATAYAHAILRRARAAARLLRRLEAAVEIQPARLMQIAVHDTLPTVRTIALKYALALPGGPLSSQPAEDWTHGGALFQALSAAAHSDHSPLVELAGAHLSAHFLPGSRATWSESMLIAAAQHGIDRGVWRELVSAMGEVGGQRCLDYLVDYAEGWFGLRKGTKQAEAAITTLMTRLGGDTKGALSVVEPLSAGAVSLIAPLDDDDEDDGWA